MGLRGRRPPSESAHTRAMADLFGRLSALGFAKYKDYIASEHWKAVRAAYAASSKPQTCPCGARANHLHHLTYGSLGRERLDDLVPLCEKHHDRVHNSAKYLPTSMDMRKVTAYVLKSIKKPV